MCRLVARGDRPAPPRQRRRPRRRRPRHAPDRRAEPGDDGRVAPRRPGRPPRRPRQGTRPAASPRSRPPASSASRSPPGSSSASARTGPTASTALEAIAASHRRHGHVQEVIVQNFLPKPGTAMHAAPPCPRGGVRRGHRPRPPRSSRPRSTSRRRRTCPTRPPSATSSRPASTTGAASRRSPPTTSTPNDRGRPSSASAPPPRQPASSWHPASPSTRSSSPTRRAGSTTGIRFAVLDRVRRRGSRPRRPRRRASASASRRRSTPAPAPTSCRSAGATPPGTAARRPRPRCWSPIPRRRGHGVASREVLDGIARRAANPARTSSSPCSRPVAARSAPSPRSPTTSAAGSSATTVTFVRNRNINYTNVCTFKCRFCGFSKGPLSAQPAGHAVPPHARRHRRARCARRPTSAPPRCACRAASTPTSTATTTSTSTRAVTEAAPGIHIHGFTALEVTEGARRLGEPLADYLRRLMDAGLRTLPGTAAEILDDDVRAVLCPDKINTEEWLEAHRTAHAVGLRSQRHDHVRVRRVAAVLGPPPRRHPRPPARRPAGSPSSSGCPSCTWRRRSTSSTARPPGPDLPGGAPRARRRPHRLRRRSSRTSRCRG